MKQTILGVLNNREQAERLVNQLQAQGFLPQDISVLFANESGELRECTTTTTTNPNTTSIPVKTTSTPVSTTYASTNTTYTPPTTSKTVIEHNTKAPEGATTGAVAGGVVGGALGLLVGLGSLAIPGLGPFIAAGPLMAALAGSGIGGSVGVLVGALVGMGIPEEEAKRIETYIKKNNFLVALQVDSVQEVNRARDIFKQVGAHDITVSAEKSTARY